MQRTYTMIIAGSKRYGLTALEVYLYRLDEQISAFPYGYFRDISYGEIYSIFNYIMKENKIDTDEEIIEFLKAKELKKYKLFWFYYVKFNSSRYILANFLFPGRFKRDSHERLTPYGNYIRAAD